VPAAPAPAPAPAAEAGVEQITVTGSAIRRRDLITPAPVSILDRVDMDASGFSSLGQILQNIPEQSAGINVQFNNGGDGSTRINLRGLGTGRTLVLVNGRRFVPGGTGADGSVDLNAVPSAIVDRIEILKDGASAIYGSDAISGVVNIITKKRFNGVDATVYTGATTHGDGFLYDLSATAGIGASNGGVVFSAGYYKQNDIFSGDRDWSKVPFAYDFNDTDVYTVGSSAIPQGRFSKSCGGIAADRCVGNDLFKQLILMYPTGKNFTHDATAPLGYRPFNTAGVSNDGNGNYIGDFFNYAPSNYLVTPQQRYFVYSNGDHDFGQYVRGYFEAEYLNRRSDQLLAPEPIGLSSPPSFPVTPVVYSADNIYNPFGRDFVNVRRRVIETGGRHFTQDIDTSRVVLGVDGSIPGTNKDWSWDASFNFGRTSASGTIDGEMIISHLRNALGPSFYDDPVAKTGPHCGTPTNVIAGCVPVDFFHGPGTITQDMLNYLSYTGVVRGFDEQKIASLQLTGKLFDMPSGGPVSLAIGGQFDREDAAFQPDPYQAAGDNIDGAVGPTAGGFNVVAAFAEVSATLLQNVPGANKVELTGAVRGGSYNTFGSFVTGKGGLRWQIVPDLALRGTVSNAFRAPAVGELYAGNATSFPTIPSGDPCSVDPANPKCVAQGVPADFSDTQIQLPENVGGNNTLQPEKATTFTAGAVITPSFFKGFSITLDYFNIDIKDAIDQEGATVILNNCYVSGSDAECAKIHRDPGTHSIVLIDDLLLNTPGLRTAGMDFDVAYRFRVRPIGNLRVNLEGTWLHKYEKTIVGGKVVDGLGNYDLIQTNPKLKFNFNVFWANAGWNAAATVHIVGPWHECYNNDCSTEGLMASAAECADPTDGTGCNPIRDVDPYFTLNLQLGKEFKSPLGKTTFTIGVLNVADRSPPLLLSGGSINASDASTYDYLGRFAYARLSQGF